MIHKYIITVTDEVKGFDKAIEQLDREWGIEELEPCDDAISRAAIYEALSEWDEQDVYLPYHFKELVAELPSVTPTVSKMEQVEDCIRRSAVLALAEKGVLVSNGNYQAVCKVINELPSVMPKRESESDD